MTVMVAVILGILKVIGILLLIVLGLILLVLLCALFVPVRYHGQAKRSAAVPLQGRAGISWCFHLFGIQADITGKEVSVQIRIFGLSLDTLRGFFDRVRGRKSRKRPKDQRPAEKTAVKEKKTQPEQERPAVPVKNTLSEEKTAKTNTSEENSPEKAVKEHADKESSVKKSSQETPSEELSSGKKQDGEKSHLLQRFLHVPEKLFQKIKKLCQSAGKAKKDLHALKSFIDRQETKGALRIVWKKAIRLGRHVLPRRLKGYLTFGFSDPADTGYLLALLGALYPVYGGSVEINPDFQQKRLEFALQGSGRIYGIVVLVNGLQLFFDKNIQFILKHRKRRPE